MNSYVLYSLIFWSLSGVISTAFSIRQFNRYWFLRFNEHYYTFSSRGKKIDTIFLLTSTITGLLVVFPNIFSIWDYYRVSNKFIYEQQIQAQISIPKSL